MAAPDPHAAREWAGSRSVSAAYRQECDCFAIGRGTMEHDRACPNYLPTGEILDACCGGKMWWWDKRHPLAVYIDKRERPAGTIHQKPLWNVAPDIVADFRALPFADETFQLVVFDPPHQVRSRAGTGINAEQYGAWEPGERDEALTLGLRECWRVVAPGGTVVFKWGGRVTDVQSAFPVVPIVGTRPRGRKEGPAWVIFYKPLDQEAALAVTS